MTRPQFICPASMRPHCELVLRGEYDIPSLQFDQRQPGPRVLDVGACVGAFAIWAVQRWLGAQVDCYEPWPDNFAMLEKNVAHEPGIRCHRVAICEGQPKFMHPGRNNCGECSMFDLSEQDMDPDHRVPVDNMHPERLGAYDVVKLDTEGCELEILQGMRGTPPRAVMLEWHRAEDRWKIGGLLSEVGFRCVADVVRRPDRGIMKWLLT